VHGVALPEAGSAWGGRTWWRRKWAWVSPEVLCERLEELEAATREETVKGYKVKVHFRQLPDHEKDARKKALSDVLVQSHKRHKDR